METMEPINKKELPDGSLLCHFTIPGRAITKKNSPIMSYKIGRPILLPSKQFKKFEAECKPYCTKAWTSAPIDFGIAIRISAWMDKHVYPDHVGVLQSLGDIFQKWGILSDDKWIHWTDKDFATGEASHWLKGKDADNARTDVWIYRFRSPIEAYEDSKASKH